jgi:anti-sigma factor RsiW
MSERKPYIPCSEVLEFLWAYVSGELPPEHAHEFDRHLAVCPSCTAYLDSYRKTIELSHESFQPGNCEPEAEDLPEDLIQAVLAARGKG